MLKEGKWAIHRMLRELESFHYVHRKPVRDSKGRILEWLYTVSEFPMESPPTIVDSESEPCQSEAEFSSSPLTKDLHVGNQFPNTKDLPGVSIEGKHTNKQPKSLKETVETNHSKTVPDIAKVSTEKVVETKPTETLELTELEKRVYEWAKSDKFWRKFTRSIKAFKTVLKSTHVRSILQQYKEATEPQDEEQQQYKEATKPKDEEQRKKKQYEEEQIRKCPYCDREGYMRIANEKDGETRYSGSIRCPHSEEDIRRRLREGDWVEFGKGKHSLEKGHQKHSLESNHNHLKEKPLSLTSDSPISENLGQALKNLTNKLKFR